MEERPDRSVRSLFVRALVHLRRAWPQCAAADLATRVAGTLLLAPLVAFVARAALNRAGGGVVTDQDILWFLLSPLGVGTLLVIGAGSLLAGMLGHAAIMTVAAGLEEDRAVSWFTGVRLAGMRVAGIAELVLRGLVRLLIDASPWLAIAGGLYLLLLGEHDINYYLDQRPPRFWLALASIGSTVAALVWFVGRRLLGFSIALPRLLFGGATPATALRWSAEAIAGRRRRVLLLFAAWGAFNLVCAVLITAAASWLGQLWIPVGGEDLARTAAGLAIASLLAGLGNLAVSVTSSVLLALCLFELDQAWTSSWTLPHRMDAEPGSLSGNASLHLPKWSWLVLALGLPLVVGYAGLKSMESLSSEDHVLVAAHRGASGRAPENTLAAMLAAIEDGADWVELDVQETSDGVVVVHHDMDFMRVAQDRRKIWDTPWSEVAAIPNGGWFGPDFEAERVASLEQVLKATRGSIGVMIELKTYGRGQRLEERVVEIVERLEVEDQVVLMSLDRPTVERLNRLRPDWTVGLLAAVTIGNLTRVEADFLAVSASSATAGFVRDVHESGKQLWVWTVNHPAQMSSMMSLAVDGIITDEPALARRVLEQRAVLSPVERLLVGAGARLGVVEGADESSDEGDA